MRTAIRPRAPGDSCPEGWFELHPFLDRYQTFTGGTPPTCSPTGSAGGEWHAASGSSNGWQQWSIDLNEYAGTTVEISISYISDWSTQNLALAVVAVAAVLLMSGGDDGAPDRSQRPFQRQIHATR